LVPQLVTKKKSFITLTQGTLTKGDGTVQLTSTFRQHVLEKW